MIDLLLALIIRLAVANPLVFGEEYR